MSKKPAWMREEKKHKRLVKTQVPGTRGQKLRPTDSAITPKAFRADAPTLAEALDEVQRGMEPIAEEFGEVLLPPLRKFVDVALPLVWLVTGDCIITGEPPYGGIWSRHQMKSR
jgi:hypothetical protein